jgi:ADP-heptose:LPS heptosyltransferase
MPNWLGDMVMSAPALALLFDKYPDHNFTLICKKGLEGVLSTFLGKFEVLTFNKAENKGLLGVWRFGKKLNLGKEDIYVCFPNSLSSALMAFASGAGTRVGYSKEGRGFLLNRSTFFEPNIHRVEQYFNLIKRTFNLDTAICNEVKLFPPNVNQFERKNILLVSFNSEAKSRRMPLIKAISILNAIKELPVENIVLLGGPKDVDYNNAILTSANLDNLQSLAGKTSLTELAQLMSEARGLLTVDSGPSHLANALGLPTLVMHGADDENNTEAYNKASIRGIRYGKLPCEPCVKNVCKLGEASPCLLNLDEAVILHELKTILTSVN